MSDLIVTETDREYCTECREGFENNPKFTIHPDCLDHIKGVNYDNLCPQCGNPAIASFKTCLKCNSGHVFVNYKSIFESRINKLQIRYSGKKGFIFFCGLFLGLYFGVVAMNPIVRDLHLSFLLLMLIYLLVLKKVKPERYERLNTRLSKIIEKYWRQPMLFELIEDLEENP